jgi:hypothetical protein
MREIRVECYAGHRADERPLRFVLRGREFVVSDLDGRWYSPEASYFRVLADNGNYYVLRHDEVQDLWTLDGFRAAGPDGARFRDTLNMTKPDMRRHERLLVPEGVEIRVLSQQREPSVDGVASVVGLGGMFMRTKDTQPSGTILALSLECSTISLEFACTVRYANDSGMGIEFTGLTSENEEKLKGLLRQLRN